MLVNNDFDAVLVHAQRFAERTGFAHQNAAALAQGAAEGFDNVGLARLVAPVRVRRQHGRVGGPLVGVVPAVATVTVRQRGPEPTTGRSATGAQHPGHDASAGPLDGQLRPHFSLFAAHKRPHFIQFKCFLVLALGFFWPQARQGWRGLRRFFCQLGHGHARNARGPHDAALRVALG